jgi:2-dehydro-3-deoxy-D-arabinonate dehydratase
LKPNRVPSARPRAVGHLEPVRIRPDSKWNVPEPELTLVIDAHGDIAGYCAGNDMSSRDIEGENPLYLPQAKVFRGSCAVGPGLRLASGPLVDVPIRLEIRRDGKSVFGGETTSRHMKRSLDELIRYLRLDLEFPQGVLLMTGTGIVPGDDFTLRPGDSIRIEVGELVLENRVDP